MKYKDKIARALAFKNSEDIKNVSQGAVPNDSVTDEKLSSTGIKATVAQNVIDIAEKSTVENSITNGKIKVNNVDISVYDDTTIVSTLANNTQQLNKITDETTLANFGKNVDVITVIDDNNVNINYNGTWSASIDPLFYNGGYHSSNIKDNAIEFTFIGTGINIYDSRNTSRGIIQVFIDGVSKGTFDRYSTALDHAQKFYTIKGLVEGTHTLRIVITGTKNTNATDCKFLFDYIEVISTNTNSLCSKIISKIGLPSTLIVAGVNSTYNDKIRADYVCDGINDEVEIQQAIDYFSMVSGKVILCNGDYYIDSLYDTGTVFAGKFGIAIKNVTAQREIIIEGSNAPLRKMDGVTQNLTVGAILHLNLTVYNALTTTELVTIIGVLPYDLNVGGRAYPAISLIVKNIGIVIPDNKKSTILLDAFHASKFKCDSIIGSLDLPRDTITSQFNLANINCIGIRGVDGWNWGEGYRIDNCFMFGMGICYNLSGEHLIMADCGARDSLYGYTFGLIGTPSSNVHTMTLINCSMEGTLKGMLFGDNLSGQQITIIDFCIETGDYRTFATEQIKGAFRGSITYTMSNNNINIDSMLFWTDGCGSTFKTVNTHQLLQGTTAQRPIAPNLYQKYIDTSLGKEIQIKALANREIDTLTVTSGATVSGDITITLNGSGNAFVVAVLAGDTIQMVGDKIRARANTGITITNVGWTISGTGGTIIFSSTILGVNIAPTVANGVTGVTSAFAVTPNTNNVWMDAMGTIV